jgi:hypothetical protein
MVLIVKEFKLLNRMLFLGMLLLVQTSLAVEVKGLYEIEVMAKSRSQEDRNAATQKALKVVLGRVLAADDVLQTPVVKTAIAGASHYVRQFQFSMSSGGKQADERARLLRVLFDEQQLLGLLRSSHVGIWGEIRPETLVWLVVEKQGDRQFYSADTMHEVENALARAVQMKGLPIFFPMLDLEEQRKISVNDVLSADSRHLLEVSERYDVVSVMAGRLVYKGRCWRAEWALYFDNQIKQWVSPCSSLNDVVLIGMQGTYDVLSKYYGVKPEMPQSDFATLKVKGIKGMTEMIRVTDYLESLSMIKSVSWISVEGGYNVYKINYTGSVTVLTEELVAADILTPVPGNGFSKYELKYRLVKKFGDDLK